MTEVRPVSNQLPAPEFNLETSQTRALQNNQQFHFHLLHSLYAERSVQIDRTSHAPTSNNGAIAEGVLQEINQGQGSAKMFQQAERVNLAAPTRAA